MLELPDKKAAETDGLCLHGNFPSSCPTCLADIAATRERLKAHLADYLGLKTPEEAERIRFIRGADLPDTYNSQYLFLHDERLANVMIAVIPDELWVKGKVPSESSAERGLISVRASYFKGAGKDIRDPSAWMTHELAHCQCYFDLDKDEEKYKNDAETPAFNDIEVDTYPNNKIEEGAFAAQFAYLKSKGVERAKVTEFLKEFYDDKAFRFLNKILDRVYGHE